MDGTQTIISPFVPPSLFLHDTDTRKCVVSHQLFVHPHAGWRSWRPAKSRPIVAESQDHAVRGTAGEAGGAAWAAGTALGAGAMQWARWPSAGEAGHFSVGYEQQQCNVHGGAVLEKQVSWGNRLTFPVCEQLSIDDLGNFGTALEKQVTHAIRLTSLWVRSFPWSRLSAAWYPWSQTVGWKPIMSSKRRGSSSSSNSTLQELENRQLNRQLKIWGN
eukprot:1155928-Pelagomonas_calceolata.AAC.2